MFRDAWWHILAKGFYIKVTLSPQKLTSNTGQVALRSQEYSELIIEEGFKSMFTLKRKNVLELEIFHFERVYE